MADARLVITDDIERLLIDVLRRRHVEHIAKVERQRELAAQTLQPLVTVSHLANESERLSSDACPAVLVGFIGLAGPPVRNDTEALDVSLNVGVQVTVIGQNRRDTLKRRDVYAWTVIECLLQRTPRESDGLIESMQLIDAEPVEGKSSQRTLAEMRIVFEVGVPNMLAVAGGLPPENTPWVPGGPGGPPEDPYDPPADPPQATEFRTRITREALTE